jgi:hypothetical protein
MTVSDQLQLFSRVICTKSAEMQSSCVAKGHLLQAAVQNSTRNPNRRSQKKKYERASRARPRRPSVVSRENGANEARRGRDQWALSSGRRPQAKEPADQWAGPLDPAAEASGAGRSQAGASGRQGADRLRPPARGSERCFFLYLAPIGSGLCWGLGQTERSLREQMGRPAQALEGTRAAPRRSTPDALRAGARQSEPGEGIGAPGARRALSLGERPPLSFFFLFNSSIGLDRICEQGAGHQIDRKRNLDPT